ncbi:MAG: Grx4 family monothiol glutaredoxin [Myxococcales bacterium]|nr:Grx4 family monothiol glutaredoxin [Myxococcales bacterium]
MDETLREIEALVKENAVVLFMKGTRQSPQCGFSARVVEILDDYLPEYLTVNVLADAAVREGIKAYSSWPTIPQLYVKGTFVGGCDIVTEMNESGELESALGVTRAELATPEIFVSEAALAALRQFSEGQAPVVRLEVSPQWQYGMDFDEPRPSDIVVMGDGWTFLLSRATARKVDGLRVDFVEGPEGSGFKIDNPNEPPKVRQLPAPELKAWMDAGKPMEVIDVRTPEERATAAIEGTRLLDETVRHELDALDRSRPLVFFCHHGGRSQRAAEQALQMGFTDVFNLIGGIDAWSQQVDPSVPRY